jgi:transposase
MSKYTTFVGMDVHARSYSCKAVFVETGQTWSKSFRGKSKNANLETWLHGLPGNILCAYESGCTGFDLARKLISAGFDCEVIAISSLPRSTKDKVKKCDRLDAASIMREMANPVKSYSSVWIPPVYVEAARELARLSKNAASDLARAKQRVTSFLMVHGYTWDELTAKGNRKDTWTKCYRKWLNSLTFEDELTYIVFKNLVADVDKCETEDKRIKELVAAEAQKERWKPFVDALCRLQGINTYSAFLIAAEIGSFERFKSGRRVSSWIGTTPINASSGEKEAHGKISKDGNHFVRNVLVEASCGMHARKHTVKALPKGVSVSAEVEAIARKANTRLMKKYKHLTVECGKNANKARIAVVSEMVRWIWIIGLQVERECAM